MGKGLVHIVSLFLIIYCNVAEYINSLFCNVCHMQEQFSTSATERRCFQSQTLLDKTGVVTIGRKRKLFVSYTMPPYLVKCRRVVC